MNLLSDDRALKTASSALVLNFTKLSRGADGESPSVNLDPKRFRAKEKAEPSPLLVVCVCVCAAKKKTMSSQIRKRR